MVTQPPQATAAQTVEGPADEPSFQFDPAFAQAGINPEAERSGDAEQPSQPQPQAQPPDQGEPPVSTELLPPSPFDQVIESANPKPPEAKPEPAKEDPASDVDPDDLPSNWRHQAKTPEDKLFHAALKAGKSPREAVELAYKQDAPAPEVAPEPDPEPDGPSDTEIADIQAKIDEARQRADEMAEEHDTAAALKAEREALKLERELERMTVERERATQRAEEIRESAAEQRLKAQFDANRAAVEAKFGIDPKWSDSNPYAQEIRKIADEWKGRSIMDDPDWIHTAADLADARIRAAKAVPQQPQPQQTTIPYKPALPAPVPVVASGAARTSQPVAPPNPLDGVSTLSAYDQEMQRLGLGW